MRAAQSLGSCRVGEENNADGDRLDSRFDELPPRHSQSPCERRPGRSGEYLGRDALLHCSRQANEIHERDRAGRFRNCLVSGRLSLEARDAMGPESTHGDGKSLVPATKDVRGNA